MEKNYMPCMQFKTIFSNILIKRSPGFWFHIFAWDGKLIANLDKPEVQDESKE